MLDARASHNIMKSGGHLVACGYTSDCEKYDPVSQVWSPDATLNSAIKFSSASQLTETDFAIGRKKKLLLIDVKINIITLKNQQQQQQLNGLRALPPKIVQPRPISTRWPAAKTTSAVLHKN